MTGSGNGTVTGNGKFRVHCTRVVKKTTRVVFVRSPQHYANARNHSIKYCPRVSAGGQKP